MTMKMHCWSQSPPTIVGEWREEPLEKTVSGRTYTSNWTPYGLKGEVCKLTHSGKYLKVAVDGKYTAFHPQLVQDDLRSRHGLAGAKRHCLVATGFA